MNLYQISSRSRHLRYVFFVGQNISPQKLKEIMSYNQALWGGRYNPIIPIVGDSVSNRYKAFLSYFDPDIVFYTADVKLETLTTLGLFNPFSYTNLDTDGMSRVLGVNALHTIKEVDKFHILCPTGLYKVEAPLKSYFQLNYGLGAEASSNDIGIVKGAHRLLVNKENLNSVNEMIASSRVKNLAHASRNFISTQILRNLSDAKHTDFEIVLSKDESVEELLYFWNRIIFECRDVMFITVEQWTILCADAHWGTVMERLNYSERFQIVSFSLSDDEIAELIDKAKAFSAIRFERKKIKQFPFEANDNRGWPFKRHPIQARSQTQISEKGIYYLPILPFGEGLDNKPQNWIVDINLKRESIDYLGRIKFPLTTQAGYIVHGAKVRVNLDRDISVLVHSQEHRSEPLKISVMAFSDYCGQVCTSPVVNGNIVRTPFHRTGRHDDSAKLLAFLNLFKNDFNLIQDFLADKFWMEIFQFMSDPKSAKSRYILLQDIFDHCKQRLPAEGITLGPREQTHHNEDNLILGLSHTIQELSDSGILLKGLVYKCPVCSSTHWYSINSITDPVKCQGCFQHFNVPIEAKFGFKLNDLIRNNIYRPDGNHDGNLTVIRTLMALKSGCRNSFEFSPQLDLFADQNDTKPVGDLDIVALTDGKLVIGEAKHNSKAFFEENNKSLKSIVEAVKAIRPDNVILTCYEDHVTNKGSKLQNAEKSLRSLLKECGTTPIPKIECFVVGYTHFNFESYRYFYH